MTDTHLSPQEKFVGQLVNLNVKLPVNVTNEVGAIADADGRDVITIDVNSERPDNEVEQIALWVVLAINTCGGFKAEQPHG